MTVELVEITPKRAAGGDAPHLAVRARTRVESRPATVSSHRIAVERVVATMRESPEARFSLRRMADIALLSPYHFNRVFRSITGVPPQTFLTCLRMQTAKKLLLTTALRVTDVCFSVGYQSVGTFTSRFTELVGVPPRQFRELSKDEGALLRAVLRTLGSCQRASDGPPGHGEIAGGVHDPDFLGGPIFVGLFPTHTPGRYPTSCALLSGPDDYRMTGVADGRYQVMAACFAPSSELRDYLLPDHSRLRVGSSEPLVIRDGEVIGDPDLTLRPMEPIDPPIVVALHATNGWVEESPRRRAGRPPSLGRR